MLFHVTLSHDLHDCPGVRPAETPELVAGREGTDQLAAELGVTRHVVLWGAPCLLWAQPPHVAYLVVEAPDVDTLQRYLAGAAPKGWQTAITPVWHVPAQLDLVQQVLASSARLASPLAPGAAEPQPTPGQAADDQAAAEPATLSHLLGDFSRSQSSPAAADEAAAATMDPLPTVILSQRLPESGTERIVLQCRAGPLEGTSFEVGEEGATVGRLPESPIFIPDARLSRQHASIEFRDGAFWLVDLGSTNGTAVNGTLIRGRHRLRTGDSIELGSTSLVVTVEERV